MPRTPFIVALLVVAYVAESAYVGYTPARALLTTHVSLATAATGDDSPVTMGVGDSVAVEACIHATDPRVHRFVADCADVHPLIFRFGTDAPRVVSVGPKGTVRALAPGRFRVGVRSMGRSAWLEGEVVERVSLVLSTRDTTLRVGDEMVVGWTLIRDEDRSELPLAELEFGSGTLESDEVATMQPLSWSYGGGARITARRPGHACYRLTGHDRTTWLSVVIVDARGATRDIDGRSIPPERLGSCGATRGATAAADGPRVRLPRAAIDHPRVQPAAMRFFAIETCLDSLGRRLGRLPLPGEEGGVVGRCLDATRDGPHMDGWLAGDFQARYPEFDVNLVRTAGESDGATRTLTFLGNELTFRESEERGGRRVAGPSVRLQGDETQVVGAVLACAALHRSRTGHLPPTLDALLAFAKTVWLARAPGEPDPSGCESAFFPRRAAGASGWVHESRRFVVRYAPAGDFIGIALRPVRYGETGVVSLRYDEGNGMRRTLENREATVADPELVRGETPTDRWRLTEAP